AGRVTDQDRRRLELADDAFQPLDDRRHGELLDRRRVGVERLDLDVEARIGGRENAVALALVVGDPALPAAWRHPEAVDQDDGVGRHRARIQSPTLTHKDTRRTVPDIT